MPAINIPKSWVPRDYQWPLWDYLDKGGKRALAIYHRRSGKDEIALMWAARASQLRVGNYWHMMPQSNQCRRAIWEAVNPETGKRRIDEAFPDEIVQERLQNEMFIRFRNGSTWSVIGSDAYNNLIGSSPAGLVFSEWATSDANAWIYLESIVNANHGWALFISTPRGSDNHCSTMYESRRNDPTWFTQVLSAHDTGVFTEAQLADARASYIDVHGDDVGDAYYRQEYLCSFTAALVGAYYGREMERAETEERIGHVVYDAKYPVHTAWDIGIFKDATAIILFQLIGQKIHIINYLENSGVSIDWYARELKNLDYTYQHHVMPHDIMDGEFMNPRGVVASLRTLGINPKVLPQQKSVHDGINAVRQILPMCWFDRVKCKRLISALKQYHRTWDDTRKCYSDKPYHDWTSNPADALRYLAMSNLRNTVKRDLPAPKIAIV